MCLSGTNECSRCVTVTVRESADLGCNFSSSSAISSFPTKITLMDGKLLSAHMNKSIGVWICLSYGLCRLAFAASHLTDPPTPSQGSFPCEVAKKCRYAVAAGKSLARQIKLEKFFRFLYCDAAPSKKYTII